MAEKEIRIQCSNCRGKGAVRITNPDMLRALRCLQNGSLPTPALWRKMGKRYRERVSRTALNELMRAMAGLGLVTRAGGTKGHGRAIVWELAQGGEA